MIETEEFSFFFEEASHAIDNLLTHILSVEIRLAHIRVIIGSLGNLGDEPRVHGWCEDIGTCEECLGTIRTESHSHTRYTHDICFLLHAS